MLPLLFLLLEILVYIMALAHRVFDQHSNHSCGLSNLSEYYLCHCSGWSIFLVVHYSEYHARQV